MFWTILELFISLTVRRLPFQHATTKTVKVRRVRTAEITVDLMQFSALDVVALKRTTSRLAESWPRLGADCFCCCSRSTNTTWIHESNPRDNNSNPTAFSSCHSSPCPCCPSYKDRANEQLPNAKLGLPLRSQSRIFGMLVGR